MAIPPRLPVGLPPEAVFSVSEYLDLVNGLLQPIRVTVQGEVTQVQERGSAVYFTLADSAQKATLSGLIWRDKLFRSGVTLQVGSEYACVGAGNIYKPTGRLSFMTETISPRGEGALQAAFERLKLQLEQEGFFSPGRKRIIPEYVEHVLVITSAQGDALRDFRTHLGMFGYTVDLIDVRVEGVQAVASIVEALNQANSQPNQAQVIVLTRGGGSLESLQAFNSREVAEAIFRSKIPVLSAVGHEKDITIADLVADVRASTPTDAGKILSRDWSLAAQTLQQTQQAITWRIEQQVRTHQQTLETFSTRWFERYQRGLTHTQQQLRFAATQGKPLFQRFASRVEQMAQSLTRNHLKWHSVWTDQNVQLEAWNSNMIFRSSVALDRTKNTLRHLNQMIEAQSPRRRLAQGYVWMKDQSGSVVRSVDQVIVGQTLQITLGDGSVKTLVDSVQPEKNQRLQKP